MTGAFTSLDSYAGQTIDPLSMNRFLYAEANPSSFVDPDGHCLRYIDDICNDHENSAEQQQAVAAQHQKDVAAAQRKKDGADDKIEAAYITKHAGGATSPAPGPMAAPSPRPSTEPSSAGHTPVDRVGRVIGGAIVVFGGVLAAGIGSFLFGAAATAGLGEILGAPETVGLDLLLLPPTLEVGWRGAAMVGLGLGLVGGGFMLIGQGITGNWQ